MPAGINDARSLRMARHEHLPDHAALTVRPSRGRRCARCPCTPAALPAQAWNGLRRTFSRLE
eukprot:11154758-Lingulodinium_polyedra.AAC.1